MIASLESNISNGDYNSKNFYDWTSDGDPS